MSANKPYTHKAMKDHATTYGGFKSFMVRGIVVVVLILLALAIFVA